MKRKIKPFPAIMTFLSALYIIYVRSSEDTTLVADAVGGDPGGKLLPTIMGAFMFVGFLYLTMKERPDGKHEEKNTKILFWITLALSVMYVALLKPVGFIIISMLTLYTLEYLYTTINENRNLPNALIGGAGTLGVGIAVYMLMRFITKSFLQLAHAGALPAIFGSTVFEGCISILLIVCFTLLFSSTVCKKLKRKNKGLLANACLITFATTLILYIIFKQFFNVSLAPGLLNY